MDKKELMRLAREARRASYCPYSGVAVGAALITTEGHVYSGANIENAAFSPSVCAERVALFKAIEAGERSFSAIAVAGGRREMEDTDGFAPCGVCRQVMAEFCDGDFKVLLKDGEKVCEHSLDDLLPLGFTNKNFG